MAETQNAAAPGLVITPLSRWRYVERLKLCLEIAAILTAGVWAYTRFIHDEAPSLELRADLNGTLNWENVTREACQAEYEVNFQNIGKLPVTIAATQLSVWYLSDQKKTGKPTLVEYLDPMNIREAQPLYSSQNKRLNGTYLPGEKDSEGFSFVVQNAHGRRMLFEIEIWSEEDAGRRPLPNATWHDFHWDYVCGERSEKRMPKRSKK
jgi:hypothetical protein